MADLILTLASLKNKADAVGVGTTASSSTPSLCPTKSAIPGYVTNGNSTVSISGAYDSNQLVRDADVTVSRTETGRGLVYTVTFVRTYSYGDIPAEGGSSRAGANVHWYARRRIYYSDGTYEDELGIYSDGDDLIYGPYVYGDDLENNETSRTLKGYSKPTGTVHGIYVEGDNTPIYLEANVPYISSSLMPTIYWNTGLTDDLTVSLSGGYIKYPYYYPKSIRVIRTYNSGSVDYATINYLNAPTNSLPGYSTNYTFTIYKEGTSLEIFVEPISGVVGGGLDSIFITRAEVNITLSDGTQFLWPPICDIRLLTSPS